jgi:hypothetical protein
MNRSWARFAQSTALRSSATRTRVIGTSIWEAIADVRTREQIEQAMATLREGTRDVRSRGSFRCSSPVEERIFLMQVSALGEGHAPSRDSPSPPWTSRPSHRWREVLIDTGMALARDDQRRPRRARRSRSSSARAMACDAVAIALADGRPRRCASVHHSGFATTESGHRTRAGSVWDEALRRGQVVDARLGDGIEITAPDDEREGVLGAITLTSAARRAPPGGVEAGTRDHRR